MRIRKHAKGSAAAAAVSNSSSTICQLNQSPWDVMTFSPLRPHQVEEEEDSFLGNGSFCDSIGPSESVASMELSVWDYPDDDVAVGNGAVKLEEVEEEMLCEKIDAQGWQCHRLAISGDTFCEQHKSVEHRRRGRPKKGSTSTDSNGFYYYSGFGPRWGKRRGSDNQNHEADTPPVLGIGPDYMLDDEDEDGDEEEDAGNGKKRARKPIKARSLKSLM